MRADAIRNRLKIVASARELVATHGAQASLRDIARHAEVGMGTFWRHFPSREALLTELLRERFDTLAARAAALARTRSPEQALLTWLAEAVDLAHAYSGAIEAMVAAIADPNSALFAACKDMKDGGRMLLARARDAGRLRADFADDDLFALLSALAWLRDQPTFADRHEHLFALLSRSMVLDGGSSLLGRGAASAGSI